MGLTKTWKKVEPISSMSTPRMVEFSPCADTKRWRLAWLMSCCLLSLDGLDTSRVCVFTPYSNFNLGGRRPPGNFPAFYNHHTNRRIHRAASPDKHASLTSELTKDEIARYSRHLVLKDVGMAGQRRLKGSAVLVIGAGGLGSPCLMYLAAAGLGHLGIVDADVVDTSNLQRQIIHGTSTVGVSKCQSAARRLRDVNPLVQIRLYEEEFTSASAMRIVGEGFSSDLPYDIVVDGSDNFPTKYLINDVCAILDLPWVYSAILAFEGQISFFNAPWEGGRRGPDYRDLLPVPPPPGDVPSCAEGGVLGVLPGTMGCLQATEVLKFLLGHHDGLLSGRVLIMDALAMKFSQIGLQRSADRLPIQELIDYQGFCGGPSSISAATVPAPSSLQGSTSVVGERTLDEDSDMVKEAAVLSNSSSTPISFSSIGARECLDRLSSGWTPWVLDVRLPTEHDICALPFTDRVAPHRTVGLRDIPSTGDILVYCKAGVRGKKACVRLMEQGVEGGRLFNLEGGILKWQQEIDPSLPRY